MPRLCEVYPGVCPPTEEKARKNLSQGSRRMPVGTMHRWSSSVRRFKASCCLRQVGNHSPNDTGAGAYTIFFFGKHDTANPNRVFQTYRAACRQTPHAHVTSVWQAVSTHGPTSLYQTKSAPGGIRIQIPTHTILCLHVLPKTLRVYLLPYRAYSFDCPSFIWYSRKNNSAPKFTHLYYYRPMHYSTHFC